MTIKTQDSVFILSRSENMYTHIYIYIYHFYLHICHFLPISAEQLDEKTFQTYKIGRERKRRQKEMWVVLCIVVIVEATCNWVIDKNKKINKKIRLSKIPLAIPI